MGSKFPKIDYEKSTILLVRFGIVRSTVRGVPEDRTISEIIESDEDGLSESLNTITINACSPESIR